MDSMSLQNQTNEINNSKPISRELLEEIFLCLAIKNQERTESCRPGEYIWSTDVADFVFNICETFKLKKNVKYVALEIYERFISEDILDVQQKYSELRGFDKSSQKEVIEERIKEKSDEIMKAVQLANKLESNYEYILPIQVSNMLEKGEEALSLNGIISSEVKHDHFRQKDLKALNHKINFATPALYFELLFYILYVNDSNIDESLYDSAITVLDFVYLNRAKLYDELYEALSGEGSENEDFDEFFLKVKADYMLLAAAIIACTVYVFLNDCYENILEQLHQITKKTKEDIRSFSVVISYVVMSNMSMD